MIHCINGRNNYIIRANNRPFDYQEIQLIQKACSHRKLHKPNVILLHNPENFTNNDIARRNNVLIFLNCRIILNDQLSFHIKGLDSLRFHQANPMLCKKPGIHYTMHHAGSADQKTSFSMDFKIQGNEAVCITIN